MIPPTPRPLSPRALAGVLLVATALPFWAPQAGAQQVELRHRWEAGTETVYRTSLNTQVDGGAFSQTQRITIESRQRVASVAPDGTALVQVTTEAVLMMIDGLMGRLEYDSRSGVAPTGPMAPLAQAMGDEVGRVREATYAPDGTMTASGEAAGSLITQTGLAGAFPTGAVAPGATWEHEGTVTLPSGTATSKSRFRLDAVRSEGGRPVAVIAVSMSGVLQHDASSPLAGMVDSVPIESTGEILFDVERGLMIRMTQRQTTTMTVMGQNLLTTSETLVELISP